MKKNVPCPYYFEKGYADSMCELLADERINLVDICSPNVCHFSQAMDVMKAGLALYLEKPIANSADEAYELAKFAQENNIPSQVALVYRFMPGIVAMRDRISRGDIGDIINFKFTTLHSGYLDENRKRNWKLAKNTSGGGPMLDIGVHLADAVNFVLGPVSSVSCVTQYVIRQRPDETTGELAEVDVEDRAVANIRLHNGVSGAIEVSRVASVLEQSSVFTIYGTKGSLDFDAYVPNRLTVFHQGTGIKETGRPEALSPYAGYLASIFPATTKGWSIDVHTASQMNMYNNFAQGGILFPETPLLTDAADAQAVIEACYLSAQNGGIEKSVGYSR